MSYFEVFLLGVGLSMDAFSVAVGKGLGMKKIRWRQAFLIALFFGAFQALMPAAGYALGLGFEFFAKQFAPWIAFALLLFVGIKMIAEAVRGGDENGSGEVKIRELLILAVATSLDALAAGFTFSAKEMGVEQMALSVGIIGLTTFVFSVLGVVIGNQFGSRFNRPATVVGGCVLIGIGIKILVESFLA